MLLSMLYFTFFSSMAFSKSINGAVDKFNNDICKIGLSVGLGALIFAGIKVALGKQDAAVSVTLAILGILIVLLRNSIFSFLQGLI